MGILWKGITTRRAVIRGFLGLVSSVLLTTTSPSVWEVTLGNPKDSLLFSMAIGFGWICIFSITDKSKRAETDKSLFEAQQVRSETGIDADTASSH